VGKAARTWEKRNEVGAIESGPLSVEQANRKRSPVTFGTRKRLMAVAVGN